MYCSLLCSLPILCVISGPKVHLKFKNIDIQHKMSVWTPPPLLPTQEKGSLTSLLRKARVGFSIYSKKLAYPFPTKQNVNYSIVATAHDFRLYFPPGQSKVTVQNNSQGTSLVLKMIKQTLKLGKPQNRQGTKRAINVTIWETSKSGTVAKCLKIPEPFHWSQNKQNKRTEISRVEE